MIVRYVIKFLKKVSKFSDANKMAPDNLGIVFGPTLIRSREETETGIPDPHRDPSDAIRLLIIHYKSVFQQVAEPSPQTLSPMSGRNRSSTVALSSSTASISLRSGTKSPRKRSRKTRTTRIDMGSSPRTNSKKTAIATNPRLSHLLD